MKQVRIKGRSYFLDRRKKVIKSIHDPKECYDIEDLPDGTLDENTGEEIKEM